MPGGNDASWRCAALAEAFLVLATLIGCAPALRSTRLAYTWGNLDFVFLNEQHRQQLIDNGSYIPGNSIPFGVDPDPRSNRVFFSIPSILPGSPVALATVEKPDQVDSPRLVPYPDWSWHSGARGCDGLTSVFRSETDECGRLWAIDSGVVDIANTFQRRCPPQLMVFNLTTNELIVQHRLPIPEGCQEALPVNVIVDQLGKTCSDDVFAYIADPIFLAIYVYSKKDDRSWQVTNDIFYPDVNARETNVDGVKWSFMDGVLGMTHDSRYLYFSSLISFQEGRVPLEVMRNEEFFTNSSIDTSNDFKFIGTRRRQSASQVMSKKGALFFHQLEENAIFCWDSRTSYTREHHILVEEDRKRLHFVTDMRIVERNSREELWAIDNNAQRVFNGLYRANQTSNINVIRGNIQSFGFPCHLTVLSYG